ncbi:MAG: hypothetical protein ACOYUZ_03300 [Patescibacteria group bacterium]
MSEKPSFKEKKSPEGEGRDVFEKAINKQAEAVAELESDAGKLAGEASLRLSEAAIKQGDV